MGYIQRMTAFLKGLRDQRAPRRAMLAAVVALVAIVTASALMLPALASAEGDAAGGNQPAAEGQSSNADDAAPDSGQGGADDQSQAPTASDVSGGYITQTTNLTFQSSDDPADDHHFDVTATVGADAKLLTGTKLQVQEIREDSNNQDEKASYADHRREALERLQQDDATTSGFGNLRLFRVTFVDANGNEVHPAADVQVKVSYAKTVDVRDAQDVKVLGFTSDDLNDTSKVSVLGKDKVQAKVEVGQDSQAGHMSEVTFTTGEAKAFAIGVAQHDQTITAEDDSYKVTLSYDGTAKLPEGVTASVVTLADDSDEYNKARDAVVAEKKSEDQSFDESTLGMAALDITLHDKDGNEIEPDSNGKVNVKIEAKSLPQEANGASLEVQHVEDGASQATTVTGGVQANGTSATAQFDVSGFSVFTITWTTTNGGTTSNIGNVTMHYVNDNGLEIDRTASLADGSLSKVDGNNDNIVKIEDWVNDDGQGTRKVSGYRYVRAAIGAFDGTQITAVKVQSTTDDNKNTTYQLSYTSDENPSEKSQWTVYKDSVSKNDSNNADIYLVFHSTAQSVNVHFVDEDGNILINPIYHYANETFEQFPNGFYITKTGKTDNPWYEPIQNYTFTGRVHMGETGWQGFAFSKVHAQKNGDDYRYQYTLGGESDNNWVDLTATDVYLIYRKTSDTIPVQIKYIDQNGNQMTDEAGNSLDRTIDASSWTNNQWQNLQGYSEAVDGYTLYARGIFVSAQGDNAYSLQHIDDNVRGSDDSNNHLDTTETYSDQTTGASVSGRPFNYLRYVKADNGTGKFQVGNGNAIDAAGGGGAYDKSVKTAPDSKINRYWDISGDFTVYLVYIKNKTGKTHTYTIHYVDTDGNPIYYQIRIKPAQGNNTSDSLRSDEDSITIDSSHDSVSIASINTRTFDGYEKQSIGFLGRPTASSGGVPFTSIAFRQSADKFNWDYALKNGGMPSAYRQLNLSNIDVYVVYKKTVDTTDDDKNVIVHFVDTDGNALKNKDNNQNIGTWETRVQLSKSGYNSWNGAKLTDTNDYGGSRGFLNEISSDYTFVGEYIGPDFNMDQNRLVTTVAPANNSSAKYVQWLYKDNKWYVSHGDSSVTSHPTDGTDEKVSGGYVTDIYWVYAKKVKVHYVYVDQNNTLSEIKQNGLKNPTEITDISTDKSNPTALSSGTCVPSIEGKTHIETRLGPTWRQGLTGADLGTEVVSVYSENNQLNYSFTNEGSAYTLEKQGNNDMWLYAAPTGRRFTLRKTSADADNYTIEDSQHGTLSLSLRSTNTYVATFHGDTETTEYTISKTTDSDPQQGSAETTPTKDTYTLTVHNSLPSKQTDIYEMYIDDDTSNAKVWVNDDLKYSGYFMIGRNQWIEDRMPGSKAAGISDSEKITSYYYSWDKITSSNTDGSNPTTATVNRQQNGMHWNIAYNRTQRTWLDVEADNGGRNTTDQKTVQYRVTLHYKQGDAGDWQTVSSEPLSVDYYSLLMNGSFEDPDKTKVNGQFSGDYSNEQYKSLGGVWQTTGLGSAGGKNGMDIEIVNTTNKSQVASNYRFANANAVTTADGGTQFAELNAETAGALYQDVVTHPNQYLNYWLSHRARGINRDNYDRATVSATTPEYDTMYLIIMPTKLAMTSAPDGGELKTQSDLTNFIQNHGGYDSSLATAVGQEVTYRDETNGILIEKISSNDQFWHKVNVPNGYIAKGGLTRFFFAAGPTTADYRYAISQGRPNREPTQGNFIDAVGFDQQLPTPKGFHLTVTKTFSGLSTDQIASLVDNKDDKDKDDKENFKITISDHARNSTTGQDEKDDENTEPNSTLNGAVLSFTRNDDGSAIPFTATAVDANGVNLLTGSNRGSVMQNDDNSITMTWTFLDQAIDSASTGQAFNYYARETGADLAGHSLTKEGTVSCQNPDSKNQEDNQTLSGVDNAAVIRQNSTASFTFNNVYRDQRSSDQPRVVVSKTFQGLTPSAVDELFGDGYQMIVTGTDIDNTTKSYTLTTDKSALDSNVSYATSTDDNHNTTIRWTIENQKPGTYSVTETGYNTSDYRITEITVNGETVIESGTQTPPTESMTKEGISVGLGDSTKSLSFDSEKSRKGASEDSGTSYPGPQENLPTDTNLIIAQFQINETPYYFVWTPNPVGANVAQSILDKINTSDEVGWNPTRDQEKAKTSNTYFRSGANPGTISTQFGSFNYDSETGHLSFTSTSSAASWNKFFSTVVKDSGLDTADIRVSNRYEPVVRIQKVDSGDNTKNLSGAEFRLFKLDKSSQRVYIGDDGADGNSETTSDGVFTTGDDGSVKLPALPAGTYFLEEAKAPGGYNRATKPIAFKVNDDYSVAAADKDEGKDTIGGISADIANLSWEHPFYTITVANTPGSILPNTGGDGIWLYVVAGLALVVLGGFSLVMIQARRAADV